MTQPSRAELLSLRDHLNQTREDVELAMVNVKGKLDSAKAQRQQGGDFDPSWFARTQTYARHRGREHQQILRQLADVNAELRFIDQQTLEHLFLQICRQHLPPNTFNELHALAFSQFQAVQGNP